MNILFTSDLSGMGGGETSLINICNVLKENNRITVICGCSGTLVEILNNLGIKTYIVEYRNKLKLVQNMSTIRRIIIKEHIEVIHNNDPLTSVIFYYSTIGIKRKNYWTCHGQWYNFGFIKIILIKRANSHIFCVSTKVEESLKSMGFKRTSVTYLGIPLFKYENAESSHLRKEFSINDNEFLIGAIGRFQKIKGQLKLVEAVQMLVREKENITCLLIGGCVYNNNEEIEYLTEIKDYVNKHNLNDKVLFIGERSDIPNIMHELNLLVVPSYNESFGMVAIEALASGLPVVSTPNDGVSEILDYHKDFVAETNDAIGLQKVIASYMSSIKTQEFAHVFANQKKSTYDINTIAKKYMNIFSETGGK